MNVARWQRETTSPHAVTVGILALLALIAPWLAAALLPAVAQPQAYHQFADQRSWLGVPHAANVLTNLPFLLIGAFGLVIVWQRRASSAAAGYVALFAGGVLTAFGSAWYHAAPSDATLVWDRLPIAVAFAGLVAGTLADRVPAWSGRLALAFVATAVATVLYWQSTGNLLPYLLMQACFVAVALLATARVPSTATHARGLYVVTALYALAVLCERFDAVIAASTNGIVSGHPLKHVVAAAALCSVVVMLQRRRGRPIA